MNVTQGLRRVLQTNPTGSATVDGDRRRPWREIGDRVAVLMLNSDRYLELYLGIAWVGAVIVPTNIRWSHAEIEDSLHTAARRCWWWTRRSRRWAQNSQKPFR